jgi:hypothetical protein
MAANFFTKCPSFSSNESRVSTGPMRGEVSYLQSNRGANLGLQCRLTARAIPFVAKRKLGILPRRELSSLVSQSEATFLPSSPSALALPLSVTAVTQDRDPEERAFLK